MRDSSLSVIVQPTFLAVIVLLVTATSLAAEPATSNPAAGAKVVDESTKAEAAQRFDRALKLFEGGDNAGALAEFKRIYEITSDPVVRYNMGLVYAAMSRPVDAVDALEPLVKGNALSPAQLERAKQTLADQEARIGLLSVKTEPASARVEVDGVEVASTPLTAPIRISEGKHVIGAVAEGFAPARKEIFIAGKAEATLDFALVRTQVKQLANLKIYTRLIGVEVLVDGKVVGKTPLPTSVSVDPGHHTVELRRPGYATVSREVDLGAGAVGEVTLTMRVDEASLDQHGATLVLDASESPLDVIIDGERHGVYRDPIRLPRGPHHITVSSPGYLPTERDVSLVGGQSNVLTLTLDPTPETRKNYQSTARFHRTWGWVGIVGGAAIAGGGLTLALIANSRKSDAEGDLADINRKYDDSEPPCDFRSGFAAEEDMPPGQRGSYLCNKTIADAKGRVDDAKQLRTVGFVGLGFGAAVATTGIVLLLTGSDPHKYDRRTAGSRARRVPRLAMVPGPGEVGAGLRVTF